MYLDHFGLDQPPFRITPDTRVFYPGADRGAILEGLAWAIDNGEGIIKVVGEVGSGKTVLCRMLAQRLDATVDLVYLVNPDIGPHEVVPAIAFELGLELGDDGRLGQQHRLHEALVERHAQGRRVVVFIEEAQNMPLATLEALRLLSNLETDDAKLLQIVLFGQPELDANLDSNEIRQLRERVTHAFDLRPLGRDDVMQYLNFRVRAAGYRGPDLFGPGTARALNRHACGLIRRLNVLADKCLLAAYAEGTHTLRPRHVRRAARDMQRSGHRPWADRRIAFAGLAVFLLLAALAWSVLRPAGSGYVEADLEIGASAEGERP